MNPIGHKAEAAYQVWKLTSDAHKSAVRLLEAAGADADTIELVLHATYTLAWLDGTIAACTETITRIKA